MVRDIDLRVDPAVLSEPQAIERLAARALGVPRASVTAVRVLRRSIDARRRGAPAFALRVRAWVDEAPRSEPRHELRARDVSRAEPVIIVGSGPAGLFAALELIERGVRPIVLERGRDVRGRRHDVARLCREGVVDPESNYAFGEGGAGTFSDGKLYTRSHKRGDVRRVLDLLIAHGASEDIAIDAHPHVGTNRLPGVVQALRASIVACGGEVRFESRVDDVSVDAGEVRGVVLASGERACARAVVLAAGHSARDVFGMLARRGLRLEAKPFALGVRVEHPQDVIDRIQYHCEPRPSGLPAAAYSVVERVGGRGVYSFCMCPGGITCPATTAPGEVVVNGWSPSSRGSRWATSGIVVEILPGDLAPYVAGAPGVATASYGSSSGGVGDALGSLGADVLSLAAADDALAGVAFQAAIERAAYRAGGGTHAAPAQRLVDFLGGKRSADLPPCSYRPAVVSADLADVLPEPVLASLRAGLRRIGERLGGYATNEAVVLAVESRTSSPVRVPREPATLSHPQALGLFPCGEGAGYAGGIMSAALDGARVAAAVARHLGIADARSGA